MTSAEWNDMPLMSRLSNISGEVKRCVDSRKNFLDGLAQKDYSEFYFHKVADLIELTFTQDARNRKPEFVDELKELQRFLDGEASAAYILRYWEQFTAGVQ